MADSYLTKRENYRFTQFYLYGRSLNLEVISIITGVKLAPAL